MTPLAERRCRLQTEGISRAVSEAALEELLGWAFGDAAIGKAFSGADFHGTTAFVNAVAWIACREDHHSDLLVGHNRCRAECSANSVGGLSGNDLICAAKVEALVRP